MILSNGDRRSNVVDPWALWEIDTPCEALNPEKFHLFIAPANPFPIVWDLTSKNFWSLKISVTSFGFKNGTPRDADLVFDVRFLPNPHWREELRPSTGQSPMVRNYVLSFEDAQVFLNKVKDMIEFLLPGIEPFR